MWYLNLCSATGMFGLILLGKRRGLKAERLFAKKELLYNQDVEAVNAS